MFSFRGEQDWSPFQDGESRRVGMPFDATPLLKWALVALALLVLLVLLNVLRQIYTNWLWFDALGYRSVFTTILFTRVWLLIAGALVFAAIIIPNAVFAYRSSDGEPAPLLAADLYALLKRLFVWGTAISIFFLAVLFGSILSGQWETLLRFFNSTPFNVQDPVFNRDVSFYVFDLPVLTLDAGLAAWRDRDHHARGRLHISHQREPARHQPGPGHYTTGGEPRHHTVGPPPAGGHVELLDRQIRAALFCRWGHFRSRVH